ncbi:hypothetical protein [Georgenia sp. AZ-5]|uniref:hypothetical protein n=1 Tax=Georgenia sp. AZ-5 TaxID=3367526 RepID=UPI0037544940
MHFRPGHAPPLRVGPPQDVLSAVVLDRGPEIIVALNPLRCYPSGIELAVAVRTRRPVPGLYYRVIGRNHQGAPVAHPLNLAIRVADGTTLDPRYVSDGEPDPTLTARSSEGSDDAVDASYWLALLLLAR